MWRGGCIIRSKFLGKIKEAFDKNPDLHNLLLDPFFKTQIDKCQEGWRHVAATALLNGIPIPAMTSTLAYYDGYRSERLPANLLQAQRDFFGAHTYLSYALLPYSAKIRASGSTKGKILPHQLDRKRWNYSIYHVQCLNKPRHL